MIPKDIYSNNSMIKFRISALHDFIICMLFVVQGVKALEHKLKDCPKIFWGWGSNKNIAEAINNC
jgi:hypothetical protein